MVVVYGELEYEPIDPNPSYFTVLRHMRLSEWGTFLGITALGTVWGYLGGRGIRRQAAFCGGMLGFFGGHALAVQSSSLRILGHRPNGRPRRTTSSSSSSSSSQ